MKQKQKQFTIVQLQSQMQEALNFTFGCRVEISHVYGSTQGNRKLFGRATLIYVANQKIERKQKESAKLLIAHCYDKVKRVVVESGIVQHGSSNAPITRCIRFEHE